MVVDKRKDVVIAIDLDDTLYAEYDYQTSGIRAVGKVIREVYGQDITDIILSWRHEGECDLWGRVCHLLLLPLSIKSSLLWIYRLHEPLIILEKNISDTLSKIRTIANHVVILTDGRSVSQRKKLNALGLSDLKAYISEEYQSEKPGQERFKAIMRELPASKYIYIGDNPKKDFIAPNDLGWKTFGIYRDMKTVHIQTVDVLPLSAQPDIWINSFSEIIEFI
ncbi:MAG: HAD family hydrolase [Chlorobiaceae bacterium]